MILIAREDDALPESATRVEVRGEATDRLELFDELSRALGLPDYFGRNWDAFEECLEDMTVPDLVLRNARRLWQDLPREMTVLVEIWLDSAPDANLIFLW